MTYTICGPAGRIVSRSASSVESTKKALRQAVSETVRNLSDSSVRSQSEAVFRRVISSEAFQKAKAISCYLSMRGEIDTTNIAREILRSGKSLYVPKIVSRKERKMDFLRVYSLEDLETLPAGVWGIKEPDFEYKGKRRACALDDEAETLELMVVPGVAFDESRGRLGHGKGYYDCFINTYAKRHYPTLLALALREQMLPLGQIPMLDHDRRMHEIVMADGIFNDRIVLN